MFELVHEMRERIVVSPAFTNQHILGVIIFEKTMNVFFDNGTPCTEYFWEKLGIVPFVKCDKGFEDDHDDCQIMRPMSKLDRLLQCAHANAVFGTK